MEMRALLMACLAAVFCVDFANSLTCYTCSNQISNSECLKASPCAKNDTACMTTVVKIGAGTQQQKLISKTCVSNCVKFQDFYECCSQDNCNHNEASGMRPPVEVLGAAVLVSVTRPLLWTGLG
ncbi:lymphocyte antigen 6E-like [Aquila chrysaetos chrysaetos]|uniref:lymphocyte antigen 6E-like n=1 Tax=Aquila chrysaetos chrysaetos TaxID=223781 RepID=UPI001B7D3B81|nr:lymphocyte antigen 6E-like [Aquila chrysaetos chrysaetos]